MLITKPGQYWIKYRKKRTNLHVKTIIPPDTAVPRNSIKSLNSCEYDRPNGEPIYPPILSFPPFPLLSFSAAKVNEAIKRVNNPMKKDFFIYIPYHQYLYIQNLFVHIIDAVKKCR